MTTTQRKLPIDVDRAPFEPSTRRERNRWVKIKIHWYVCAKCGMVCENFERDGVWRSRYFFPTDPPTTRVEHHVPECVPGPKTPERLAKFNDLITAAIPPKADKPHTYRFPRGWKPPF